MGKTKTQTSKNRGFAPKSGKKTSNQGLTVEERIERELAEAQAEWMAEEAQERKKRVRGVSREELMRSPNWIYETYNEEILTGTLDEVLNLLLVNNVPTKVNLEVLRQKALEDGGIDIELPDDVYETIEYDPDFVL